MRRWLAYLGMTWRSRLAWRGDWLLGALADAMTACVGLVMVLALFSHVPHVRGFARHEVVVCWGVAEAARGLFWMLGRGLYVANGQYLVGGGLDRVLLRPLHPLGQILADHLHLGAWPSVLWGLAAVWVGLGGLSVGQGALLALGVVLGALVLAGVLVGVSSVGFWFLHRGSAVGLVHQAATFAPYPPSFLPWPVAWVLSTVLPFTFVGYAPAAWLLGRTAPWWTYGQPLVAWTVLVLGLAAWHRGLRRYGSTGS